MKRKTEVHEIQFMFMSSSQSSSYQKSNQSCKKWILVLFTFYFPSIRGNFPWKNGLMVMHNKFEKKMFLITSYQRHK